MEGLPYKYEQFLVKNVAVVEQFETVLRTLSYFVPAKFKSADELGEFLYAAVNLFSFYNDTVLRTHLAPDESFFESQKLIRRSPLYNKLAVWLTVVKQSETFAEVFARRMGGSKWRWAVIWVIEVLKLLLRLYMLLSAGCDSGMLINPPLSPVDRAVAVKSLKRLSTSADPDTGSSSDTTSLAAAQPSAVAPPSEKQQLSSDNPSVDDILFSGRTTLFTKKTTASSDVPAKQTPRLARRLNRSLSRAEELRTPLSRAQLKGEILFILRPIVFLTAARVFGLKSWRSWSAALLVDALSKYLTGDGRHMHLEEKGEISRRSNLLLYYLLRSPFYERYSKRVIGWSVDKVSRLLPLLGGLSKESLLEYIEFWQDTYFDIWES